MTGTAQAQSGFDTVLFTNGVEFMGKVTSVVGDSISFMHKNETLVYRFPKTRIFRIQFASGRTELITSGEPTGGATVEKPGKQAKPVVNARRDMIMAISYVLKRTPL